MVKQEISKGINKEPRGKLRLEFHNEAKLQSTKPSSNH